VPQSQWASGTGYAVNFTKPKAGHIQKDTRENQLFETPTLYFSQVSNSVTSFGCLESRPFQCEAVSRPGEGQETTSGNC
jgi:hypothetical protein